MTHSFPTRRSSYLMKAFDHVVFLSDKADNDRFYDRRLARRLGMANVSVIPNGGALPAPAPGLDFRAAYGLGDGPIILHVANYEPLKRSEEHTSELQSLMRISYAVFCFKKKQ